MTTVTDGRGWLVPVFASGRAYAYRPWLMAMFRTFALIGVLGLLGYDRRLKPKPA